jgi:hypothetical protein
MLALAFMAALALSALAVSAASAAIPSLTSDGPVGLTGSDTAGTKSTLTAFGLKVECNITYHWRKYNETPHKTIPSGATTFTVTRTPNECVGVIGGTSTPATITQNGCDTVTHAGETIAPLGTGKYADATDIVCPGSAQTEIHIYTNSTHATTICTIQIPGQTGLAGGTVQNNGGNLQFGGPITGMKATKTGVLCGGTAETSTAEVDLSVNASGTNEGGGATSVSFSD